MPAGAVDRLEAALFHASTDEQFSGSRTNAQAIRENLRWSKLLEPLVEFAQAPERAADLLDPEMAKLLGVTAFTRRAQYLRMLRRDASSALLHAKRGDVRTMIRAARPRLNRLPRI